MGVPWYYLTGIVNLLSQNLNIENNGLEVNYSSRKDKNKIRNSVFHIETTKGIKFWSTPNKKGLYGFDSNNYFGARKDYCVLKKYLRPDSQKQIFQ